MLSLPFGAPWPVVLVLGLMGLLVYGWVQYLRHKEHMRALDRTTGNRAADVLLARTDRPPPGPP